jgi:transposase-like protein
MINAIFTSLSGSSYAIGAGFRFTVETSAVGGSIPAFSRTNSTGKFRECLRTETEHNRIGGMKCPKRGANWKQYKAGFNPLGSQRYRCGECNRVYTLKPSQHGYAEETRLLAIRMYVEGSSYRSIGRLLKVNPQSIANWVSAYTSKLPQAPLPVKVKKNRIG